MAGVTGTPENDDDGEDEDITSDMGTVSHPKSKSAASPSSSKSVSILSRSTSEFDTCAPEKSVEFDPVQGN